MKLKRYRMEWSQGCPVEDVDGLWCLYAGINPLLSRYDKLVAWITNAEHRHDCNINRASKQFVMDEKSAARLSTIKKPCDCGLDELRRKIEGEEK